MTAISDWGRAWYGVLYQAGAGTGMVQVPYQTGADGIDTPLHPTPMGGGGQKSAPTQIISGTKRHSETGEAALEGFHRDAPNPCLSF